MGRVAEMQTDIGKLALLDAGQRLGDGVDESIAADEAGAGVFRRLREQMLAPAETDFQPDFRYANREQGAQIRRRGGIRVDLQPRKARL
jgi:hypothetical protein